MAVLQMQRIFMYALKKDRKKILELVQRRGVVEISDMLQEDGIFHKNDVSNARLLLEKNKALAKDAIEILDQYVPEKKSVLDALKGRKEISTQQYDAFKEKYDSTITIAKRILSLSKSISESRAEILKYQAQLEILKPWVSLDIPLNFQGTKYTKCFIGCLPGTWTLENIYEELAECAPVDIDLISSTKDQTCIFVLCPKDNSEDVFNTLRSLDFSYPSIALDIVPIKQLDQINNLITEAKQSIENAQNEIISYAKYREDILFLQDYESMRSDKYEVICHLLQSKNVFILSGYIPEKDAKALEDELNSKFDIGVEIVAPSEEDDVPVLLENNGFASPLEGVVEAFSPPGKGEVDPTMAMALFYYVLFGLMLSDAGYGLLMVIACGIGLLKYKNTLEDSMKKTMKMYLYCGISTIFWGIMFGSYFGDLIDIISSNFFGEKISIPPLWFFPVNEPMRMLTFSMLLGIIHLFAGLGMKLYQLYKQKDYKSILYDVIFWYVLLTSLVLILLSMDMVTDILGVRVSIPTMVLKAALILAIISAAGIILTNGRESRSPFKRILKGLYALYGVSGYLGDVLSYSRLLALGLATGVICTVINQMASMVDNVIFFIIIVVIAHILNFGINALGAYVHTCRLQYVEFFGKFYEGGGRTFQPFKVNTKYFKFKEKM